MCLNKTILIEIIKKTVRGIVCVLQFYFIFENLYRDLCLKEQFLIAVSVALDGASMYFVASSA